MSDPYIGEIRMFGGNFAPNGWLFCQGQLVSIADYDTLFNLIGTTYGGDGQNTFALPDLSSRFPVHQGSGYPLGATGGMEAVTLSPNHIPVHSHTPAGGTLGADDVAPGGDVWGVNSLGGYSRTAPNTTMAADALTPAGGNQPHDNMPPFLVINFIISMYGIYPSPS